MLTVSVTAGQLANFSCHLENFSNSGSFNLFKTSSPPLADSQSPTCFLAKMKRRVYPETSISILAVRETKQFCDIGHTKNGATKISPTLYSELFT